MTDIAVHAERLTKRYRIGEREQYRTLRDTISGLGSRLWRPRPSANPRPSAAPSIIALEDVSFDLHRGEVLGIIGRNGAGKSTLLKILSRITRPTSGHAEVHGRVGSLLEVGTGFHQELTGRENIYLNGAILGMPRREIAARFGEIAAFADIGDFLDTPVKRYSSGMYMRLAFAVAAHLDPEILIVDEVLAVGDAAFQKKCLGRLGAEATSGRSVILVSHSMTAIQSLCHRVLWIDRGRIVADGGPEEVVRAYLQQGDSGCTETIWERPDVAPGNDHVRLRSASVRAADGAETIRTESPLILEFEYWNLVPGANLHASLFLQSELGVTVLNAEPVNEKEWQGKPRPAALFRDQCMIPGNLLNDGRYQVDLQFVKDEAVVAFRIDSLLMFDVYDTSERQLAWYGKWPGVIRPSLKWSTEMLPES